MAREEYDREVQARRDAEFEMLQLKEKMREQAAKLGALDELQRKQELLQRRSNDLRSSVVVAERELSKIRVERDLTVAEFEELVSTSSGLRQMDPSDRAAAPERLSVALNTRLASVKEDYRSELEQMTLEKEALQREIEDLKQTKELFAEESASLNKQNVGLVDQTAEAARKLEAIKSELAQAQQLLSTLKRDKQMGAIRAASPSLMSSTSSAGHSSTTTSALMSSTTSSASSAAMSSGRAGLLALSPTPPVDDQPTSFVAQKVEHLVAQQAPVRKFK